MNRHRTTSESEGTVSNSVDAKSPAALSDLGRRLLLAGLTAEADHCGRLALAIDPLHVDSLRLMGDICLHSGQPDQAIEWIARAVRIAPEAEHVAALGMALQRSGKLEDALKAYDKAISLQPDNAELWKDLATVLVNLNRLDEAFLGLQHALKLRPRYVDAANLCGLLLYRSGRYSEALDHFNLSIETEPSQADALHLRALVYMNLGRLEQAEADNRASLQLNPADADTHNNLGTVLQKLGRYQDSIEGYDRAIALRPNFLLALKGKASSLVELRRLEEASACFARFLALDPENADARWNLALLQMLVGDFRAGWLGREARWQTGMMRDPILPQPLWLGDRSIEGATILLYGDEGI